MQDIEKLYRKIAKSASSTPELTIEYAMATASKLTDLPLEFYQRISGKDITKIKNRIINFYTARINSGKYQKIMRKFRHGNKHINRIYVSKTATRIIGYSR